MSEQTGLVCAARHAGKAKLNVIVFPAANRTNVIAARRLAGRLGNRRLGKDKKQTTFAP